MEGSWASGLLRRIAAPFGGSEREVEVPLRLYGKLPLYKDFIRIGVAGDESQTFRTWLDRGMSRSWENDEAAKNHRIVPHALLLRFPGTGRALLGYLYGSSDEGGLREFPLSLLASIPESRSVVLLLDRLETFVPVAEAVRSELASLSRLDAVHQRLRDRKVQFPAIDEGEAMAAIRKELSGESVGQLAESLLPAEGARRFPALVAELRDGSAAAFRLPRSPQHPPVRLAQLYAALAGREPLHVMVPLGGGSGPVFFRRNLEPEDVLAFHPECSGLPQVPEPGSAPAELSEAESARSASSLLPRR